MIDVSVAGASGYTGGELVRWLSRHPKVRLVALTASEQRGRRIEESFPHLRGVVSSTLEAPDWSRLGQDSDVVFLALPAGLAMEAAAVILSSGARVIDLGADFRLSDPSSYRRWYEREHSQLELLEEAVYGLPELHRDSIGPARLVANPGCYPTATALALLPLASWLHRFDRGATIIVDAKSGVSGAGRSLSPMTHFGEVNENVRPYKVGAHRHMPEMEQTLAAAGVEARIFFSPHLVPMTRGILSACYLRLGDSLAQEEAAARFRDFYADEPFVRVLEGELPQTKATLGSNYCDVAVRIDEAKGVAVAFAALDNLVKGAAGQAIQNMNLMCGFPEGLGLESGPLFP